MACWTGLGYGRKYPTPFPDFSGLKTVREKRERRELPSVSLFDPRSSTGQNSCSQEPKFIYATRATRGYQKQRISSKIQAKSLRDRGFRVSGTSESFIFALRGRDSSYFGLFSILGAVWLSFNALRGCLAIFSQRGFWQNNGL